MSYKKVLELANKFAQKTSLQGFEHQKMIQKDQIQEFFEQFKRHLRGIINEMDGDFMTLRIMGYPRPQLKELGTVYHGLLEKANRLSDQQPLESTQEVVSFIFSKSTRILINTLEASIQHFLKNNRVDFTPGAGLTHARVDSLKKTIALVTHAQTFLSSQTSETMNVNLSTSKEEYNPAYTQEGGTKVDGKKSLTGKQ
jgi:hypothetical protein